MGGRLQNWYLLERSRAPCPSRGLGSNWWGSGGSSGVGRRRRLIFGICAADRIDGRWGVEFFAGDGVDEAGEEFSV